MDMSRGSLYIVLRGGLHLHAGLCEKDAIVGKKASGVRVIH